MNRLLISIVVATCLTAAPAFAKRLGNVEKGYSFEVPDDWKITNADFLIKAPDGTVLTEIAYPKNGTPTLELASGVATGTVKALLRLTEEGGQTAASGKAWRGLQRFFIDTAGRRVVQLVCETPNGISLFYLQVPMDQWKVKESELLTVIRSVEFAPVRSGE